MSAKAGNTDLGIQTGFLNGNGSWVCVYKMRKKLTNDAVSFSLCVYLKLLILRRILAVYASVGAGKRVDDVHVVFIKGEIKNGDVFKLALGRC